MKYVVQFGSQSMCNLSMCNMFTNRALTGHRKVKVVKAVTTVTVVTMVTVVTTVDSSDSSDYCYSKLLQ